VHVDKDDRYQALQEANARLLDRYGRQQEEYSTATVSALASRSA
jgi:hypothetical protein